MTHIQSVAKSITINNINYLIRVQSYNFFTYGQPGLRLQTNIEILKDGWEVVGCLQGHSNLEDDIPLILRMSDKNYHNVKGVYHGEEGIKSAEEYLQNLTEEKLIKAMQRTFKNCTMEYF